MCIFLKYKRNNKKNLEKTKENDGDKWIPHPPTEPQFMKYACERSREWLFIKKINQKIFRRRYKINNIKKNDVYNRRKKNSYIEK